MKKFAVFGNPIAHSLSPIIHNMFAEEVGEDISYEKICAPVDGFDLSVGHFMQEQLSVGCNVTVPFKEQAFRLASQCDAAAVLAGAVNTLQKQTDGTLHGFNTDGIGLVNDLLNHQVTLHGATVLLLGAGGAARGVVHPLLDAGVAKIVILNRSVDKAQAIVQEVNDKRVTALLDVDTEVAPFNLVINSTSASLHGVVPEMPANTFSSTTVAYDMLYSKTPTVFMAFAQGQGCQLCIDGLGMLVEQAAQAFYIWTGKRPSTAHVVDRLRSQMADK